MLAYMYALVDLKEGAISESRHVGAKIAMLADYPTHSW